MSGADALTLTATSSPFLALSTGSGWALTQDLSGLSHTTEVEDSSLQQSTIQG